MVAPGKTRGRTRGQFRRLRNIRFKDYVHGRSLEAPKNNGKPVDSRRELPRSAAAFSEADLQEIYKPTDALGGEIKPSLSNYPDIAWERMDLEQSP